MSTTRRQPESHFSVRLVTVAGIPVRMHFTFILFLVWIAWIQRPNALAAVIFVLAIFACIVLHEFGHALVARRFGVATSDITLYPIGGVAMLKSRPRPKAEFWIALAGPAVNVVIAAILLPFVIWQAAGLSGLAGSVGHESLLDSLFFANAFIAVFNLIPAFPMDGGRVLRALLGMAMPEARATALASATGQILALGMCAVGLFLQPPNLILIFIGFFVFIGAGQELQSTRARAVFGSNRVTDAMQTQFKSIASGATIQVAAEMLLSEGQHAFPVVAGDEIIGMLSRADIARAIASGAQQDYVAGYMDRDYMRFPQDTLLEQAVEQISQKPFSAALVFDGERPVGLLTREGLSEFFILEQARARAARRT